MPDTPFTIPDEVWKAIDYEVQAADLEYADNYRAYRVQDGWGKADFEEREAGGCCGSATFQLMVHGVRWIGGCNYGH